MDQKNSPKRQDLAERSEDKPRIALIGQIEELTGHDVPGKEPDGATYAYRYRDHTRGDSD